MNKVAVHRNFKLASYFILFGVGLGIVKLALSYSDINLANINTSLNLTLNVVILALLVWVAVAISRGNAWARITFAVVSASILVFTPLFLLHEFHASIVVGSLTTAFIACLLVALLLLYSKAARSWHAD